MMSEIKQKICYCIKIISMRLAVECGAYIMQSILLPWRWISVTAFLHPGFIQGQAAPRRVEIPTEYAIPVISA
jgi:hypothetical protein